MMHQKFLDGGFIEKYIPSSSFICNSEEKILGCFVLSFKEVDTSGTGEIEEEIQMGKRTFITINLSKKSMDCLLEEPYNPIIQKCCRKFEMKFRYDILIICLLECIIPEII